MLPGLVRLQEQTSDWRIGGRLSTALRPPTIGGSAARKNKGILIGDIFDLTSFAQENDNKSLDSFSTDPTVESSKDSITYANVDYSAAMSTKSRKPVIAKPQQKMKSIEEAEAEADRAKVISCGNLVISGKLYVPPKDLKSAGPLAVSKQRLKALVARRSTALLLY
jgi:hypothetical protein